MKIGFTYDCLEDYLKNNYDLDDCAELDSEKTINKIASVLSSLGHEVIKIGNVKYLINRLCNGDTWDIVFNISEGIKGRFRESQVPTILEIYDIPYVFSDPVSISLTFDKALAKSLVRANGISTANSCVVEDAFTLAKASKDLKYPLFIKPNCEGSSKGINTKSLVYSEKELKEAFDNLFNYHNQSLLVEEYLPGREFTVGMLGTGEDSKVLGVMEIKLRNKELDLFYSRDVKINYLDKVDYLLVDDEEALIASESALKIWKVLGCRDSGRIDFRSNSQNIPYFLEVNPLAGLTVDSDLPLLCKKNGLEYERLIEMILNEAVSRYPSLAKKYNQSNIKDLDLSL